MFLVRHLMGTGLLFKLVFMFHSGHLPWSTLRCHCFRVPESPLRPVCLECPDHHCLPGGCRPSLPPDIHHPQVVHRKSRQGGSWASRGPLCVMLCSSPLPAAVKAADNPSAVPSGWIPDLCGRSGGPWTHPRPWGLHTTGASPVLLRHVLLVHAPDEPQVLSLNSLRLSGVLLSFEGWRVYMTQAQALTFLPNLKELLSFSGFSILSVLFCTSGSLCLSLFCLINWMNPKKSQNLT